MPLIATPRYLQRQSEIYHQTGQLLSAGIGLLNVIEHLADQAVSRSERQSFLRIRSALGEGLTFAESLRQVPGWAPEFDVALLDAGERSGRLDQCCRLISKYYADRASMVRKILSDLAYPLFLVHFAALLAPLPGLIIGMIQGGGTSPVGYVTAVVGSLAPLYLVGAGLIFAAQSRRGERFRALLEQFLRPIPVIGKARQSFALARLSVALEALIMAGVPMIQAWELAARASGSPALKKTVAAWKPLLEFGETPADLARKSPEFPDVFRQLYATGEISGQLDETLHRMYEYFLEEGHRRAVSLARWLPKLFYLVIALSIAYQVVKFWTGYFAKVLEP